MTSDPDAITNGFITARPDASRYSSEESDEDWESPGLARDMMPAGISVLDVGAGGAAATAVINRNKGNTVLCVEPDPERARIARARGFDVRCELFDRRFAEGLPPVDIVVFGDVLEHLADPADALQLARKVLKPNGLVIVSVPNVANWTVRIKLLLGRFDYTSFGIMDATHLRWFTQKTIVGLLSSQGFSVETVRQSAGLWMPVYNRGLLRFIHPGIRRRVVRFLVRVFPRLFGVQHVILARAT